MEPLIITSIPPFLTSDRGIKSWLELGAKVISLNDPEEKPYQIEGVIYKQIVTDPEDKKKIKIRDILKCATEEGQNIVGIINSDIILLNRKNFWNKCLKNAEEGLICISRYDLPNNTRARYGHDAFIFNKDIARKMLDIVPPFLCLGRCWWDDWLPFNCYKKKIPLFWVQKRFALHKNHKKRWNSGVICKYLGYKNKLEFFNFTNKRMTTVYRKASTIIKGHKWSP